MTPNFLKLLSVSLLLMFTQIISAQTGSITKYFNNDDEEVAPSKAKYYSVFTPNGSYYDCISYWAGSERIREKSIKTDTSSGVNVGLSLRYYKNGRLEDSSFTEDAVVRFLYHYYKDGSLHARYEKDDGSGNEVIEGFDESGNRIKNFVLMREAEFKGGDEAWQKFLKKRKPLSRLVYQQLVADGMRESSVTVLVRFIIDEDGSVVDPRIQKSSGYSAVDHHVLEIMENSPKWNSAILYNEAIKAVRIQPFIFNWK